jgi:hypothetical protein
VSDDLHQALLRAFDKLKADQADHSDWHPGTNEMVLDLVHPSIYPLVYGRSRVLKEEPVGVEDGIYKWAGKGDVIPKRVRKDAQERRPWDIYVEPSYWSETYQWLPANISFNEDGSIMITSYINNLHPGKYPDIYLTVEKLIEMAHPVWNQCLAHESMHGAGRTETRFPKPAGYEAR